MRDIDRRGMAEVERGGICRPIVWGNNWNYEKKRGNGALALGGQNFKGMNNNHLRVGVRDGEGMATQDPVSS